MFLSLSQCDYTLILSTVATDLVHVLTPVIIGLVYLLRGCSSPSFTISNLVAIRSGCGSASAGDQSQQSKNEQECGNNPETIYLKKEDFEWRNGSAHGA